MGRFGDMSFYLWILMQGQVLIVNLSSSCETSNQSNAKNNNSFAQNEKTYNMYRYQYFPESERLLMRQKAKDMFYFGYDNYMKHAFPLDELNPIYCKGRGPDENRENINVNDALGGYSLTLIDTLDTLAIMGNNSEFIRAVNLVKEYVSFEKDNIVQVFEATIRVLGGLLAAHLLAVDPVQPFGPLLPENYDNDLLLLAHDLANRLLPAFEKTKTLLPWPRVNLKTGVPENCNKEAYCSKQACTAGIGTLVLEFGILARLLKDPTYEMTARNAVDALWKFRSKETGLFGNVIDVETGEWVGKMSGLGAGVDSFYEYLLKSYIVFGEKTDLIRFNNAYASINKYMRRGRSFCANGTGDAPVYVNVNMDTGDTVNSWLDSLQAAFTGVQVLRGDIDEAICSHAIYYAIWQRYGALPERFNWHLRAPDVKFYPLRPEFSEATYLLYQATKHPFYLHVGSDILQSLETHTKAKCGYATIHDVLDKSQEDRMESFFLSETMKYLFLLFDFDNPINKQASEWIFSTEGHVFRLDPRYRDKDWNEDFRSPEVRPRTNSSHDTVCNLYKAEHRFSHLPLDEKYYTQIEEMVGLR